MFLKVRPSAMLSGNFRVRATLGRRIKGRIKSSKTPNVRFIDGYCSENYFDSVQVELCDDSAAL